MSLHIEIDHLNHNNVDELKKYADLKLFFQVFKEKHLKEKSISSETKVKIISIGIYDSAEGAASRPRDVDYNAHNNLIEME
jgi:hypothetical protein